MSVTNVIRCNTRDMGQLCTGCSEHCLNISNYRAMDENMQIQGQQFVKILDSLTKY